MAKLACDEQVDVLVPVHVHRPNVVSGLVVGNDVGGEIALAVVLEPGGNLADVGASGGVHVAVAVHIADLQTVRGKKLGVHVVNLPARVLEPDEPLAVPTGGDHVEFPVPVHVGGLDVGRAEVLAGQQVLLERLGRVLARLPPSEPFALAGLILWTALGGKG